MAIKPSKLKSIRKRNYLARDFDSLRSSLLDYARSYYPDRITDFSESSLGGLFLDMAAYVGDNLSFYLDHQYNELNPETAIELNNIQKHLKSSGIKITGASPSRVNCTFIIEVPATTVNGKYQPVKSALPIIRSGTTVSSNEGIGFELLENIDFSEVDEDGEYTAEKVSVTNNQSVITSYIMSKSGACISGNLRTQTFNIGNFVQFRKLTLQDFNVSEIIKVYDNLGNTYYEVNDLSDDVVFVADESSTLDKKSSKSLKLLSAPFRFTKNLDISSNLTTLTFGGGSADSFQDDIIPDATDFAIPLPNSGNFHRTQINPNKLLNTRTLGVAAENTTLNVIYRYGGGLSHNVSEKTITSINDLKIFFPRNPLPSIGQSVTNSVEVINFSPSSGGEDAPTIDQLRELIPSIRNSQQRIVTKEDLLSRIYTMPSSFGKVFRAAVGTNYDNPFSTTLFIVSRNSDEQLTRSSDNLKKNLVNYLNEYRMISDAIDILDAPIINFKITFIANVDPRYNSAVVNEYIKRQIINYFDTSRSQINKPINISELYEILFAVDGVISLPEKPFTFINLNGKSEERNGNNNQYSEYAYDLSIATSKNKGLIYPPEGGIFELRYPAFDVVQGGSSV